MAVFFDTPNEKAETPFEVVPPGSHILQIINSEIKPTKSGTGTILVVTLAVAAGEHKDLRFKTNFNIENTSKEAQRIGRAQFKSLCDAINVTEPMNTFDDAGRLLQGKVFLGEVEHEEYNGKMYPRLVRSMPSNLDKSGGLIEDVEIPF